MTSRKFHAFTTYDKKRFKWIKGIYNGTVYSGDPTKTTFGNSLRVIFYTKYVLKLANIKNYYI